MNVDKVHPSAKPPTANGAASNGGTAVFPANKAQLYQRPAYRPQPPPRRSRHRRGCCCSCCLWTILLIVLILFFAAIAGAVFYALYRPHRPSFTVNSLNFSQFNLTDTVLKSAFNVSVTARNPNSKISFFYDDVAVTILSDGVDIGDGTFPAFSQASKNITVLRSVISKSSNPTNEGIDVTALKSSAKSKSLPIEIHLETKVKVKIGQIKTKKLGIRVICQGIKVSVPNGKTATSATTSNIKCKAAPKIKIIKWDVTF